MDDVPPVIMNCPTSDIVVDAPSFGNGVQVALPDVFATDNSGQQPTSTNNIPPDNVFLIGTTLIVITFTGASTNSANCVYNVVVNGELLSFQFIWTLQGI